MVIQSYINKYMKSHYTKTVEYTMVRYLQARGPENFRDKWEKEIPDFYVELEVFDRAASRVLVISSKSCETSLLSNVLRRVKRKAFAVYADSGKAGCGSLQSRVH